MALTTEKKIIIGIVSLTLAILVGGVLIMSRPQSAPTQEVVGDSSKELLVRDNSHQSAKDTGKIAVVEFADFQCPACASSAPILKELKKQYGDNVNFVYRYFPLSSHKHALPAALAAESAAGQGKFWEMEEKLFANQQEWSESTDPVPFFEKYAKEIGVDSEKVKNDVKNKTNESRIREDYNDGVSLGVNSTPTFFVNGKKQTGVLSLVEFKSIIDAELEGK